jgi:hypothetical protein
LVIITSAVRLLAATPPHVGVRACGGGTPNSGRGVQAAYLGAFFRDRARTEKTDTSHHIGDHLDGGGADCSGQIDEGCRVETNQ